MFTKKQLETIKEQKLTPVMMLSYEYWLILDADNNGMILSPSGIVLKVYDYYQMVLQKII